jgi:very-short-patch-repair endonuclease
MKKHDFETNIETLLREELERRGLKDGWDFVSQYPVKGSFILDFAFPDEKLYIEADGEPFHAWSKKGRQRDHMKDSIMSKKGWSVLRFTGTEIMNSPSECVDKIFLYMERSGMDRWGQAGQGETR